MKSPCQAIFAGLCLGASHAFAAAGDPADASAPVPSTHYQSPFTDYRVLGDDKHVGWRDANDTVGKIGGWRAYAREASDAAKAREATKAGAAANGGTAKQPLPTPSTSAADPPVRPARTHQHGG